MYEEPGLGYLITSRDILLTLLNKVDPAPANANEVLLESDGSVSVTDLEALVPNATQVWEVESVRKSFKADPLALGLRSVTLFGYGLTALLSLVGFATHFYTSARRRATIYGVMRAMGLSPRQLYGSLVLEQIVLIFAGLALGTGLGVLLNQLTLTRLPITLGDQPPIPPFRPHSDWLAVGRIYLGLALAFLLSLGAATLMLWRARVHRVLRIGQE
jgi:ABC-type antimicrobial peptide transport system permease subunit